MTIDNSKPADDLSATDAALENSSAENTEPQANADGLMMQLDYAAPSQISQLLNPASKATATLADSQSDSHSQHVALFTQLNRKAVSFHGAVKSPLVFRDSLLALFDVVSSDYRYVPKDRSAYTVFMQMRRANSNKNLFAAQRNYFSWLFDNDPLAFCILDPIIQVHEQGVSFEVFSRDEGCYAQLTLTSELFETSAKPDFGTTSIDYSPALFEGIEQIRDHQQTLIDIGQEAVSLQLLEASPLAVDNNTAGSEATDSNTANIDATTVKKHIIEKRINVPKSWIRALLQVQSAGQLPQDTIHLDPIALYNVLFELRMHADIKGKRRGLLIELRPQQLPVIMLEPFNITVTSQVSQTQIPYQGGQAKLIRLWGRRRLSLLKRLLPHTDSVSVSILGQGMPSYWTLKGRGFHFTFAMTGFSQANWSQSLNFDLLLPKRPQQNALADSNNSSSIEDSDLQRLTEQLIDSPSTVEDLAGQLNNNTDKSTNANKNAADYEQIHQLLLSGTQQGFIRYDIASRRYYYRPLTQTPLDMAQFAYHNPAEKQAFDLISCTDSIQKLVVETVPTKGVSIAADIHVTEDRRHYHSQLQLNEEGLVGRAECSCPQYLQHRLTQGVCAHLIALRLAYNDYDSSQANNESWHETRVLSKRVSKRLSKRVTVNKQAAKSIEKAVNTRADSATSDAIKTPSPAAGTVLDLSGLAQRSGQGNSKAGDKASEKANDDTHNKVNANVKVATSNAASMAYIYLTIAHKKITIEQSTDDDSTRQQLVFNQPAQAKAAFLQHIARFEAKGFIENQGV